MRILLTGTSGQVGGALLPVADGPARGAGAVAQRIRSGEPETLGRALDRFRPDLIVNPAAYTAVDRAEDERDLAFRVNGEAPAVMANWAARHDVPLVHFSTDYVFDGSGERPWREEDPSGRFRSMGRASLQAKPAFVKRVVRT